MHHASGPAHGLLDVGLDDVGSCAHRLDLRLGAVHTLHGQLIRLFGERVGVHGVKFEPGLEAVGREHLQCIA